ncbi:hypothetical protein NKH18_12555 [Streptomyces sp. M10(2022)]
MRYLTAPWVRAVSVRDLLAPLREPHALHRGSDGVTAAMAGPGSSARGCRSWPALELRDGTAARLMTDLGELVPARLTSGRPTPARGVGPGGAGELGADGVSAAGGAFARGALGELLAVRETAAARGRREGAVALHQGGDLAGRGQQGAGPVPGTAGILRRPRNGCGARRGLPDCGVRRPRVLAGVLWKSQGGQWYVLAAGSRQFVSLSATGG